MHRMRLADRARLAVLALALIFQGACAGGEFAQPYGLDEPARGERAQSEQGAGGSTEAQPAEPDGATLQLPEPEAGRATIGGILTINGEPRVGEEVRLGEAVADENEDASEQEDTRPSATTNADGLYVFESVEPGSYSVSVGVLVEDSSLFESFSGFGLDWDTPCGAEGFQALNAGISDQETGTPIGVIASISNQLTSTNADQVTRIDASAGQRVVVDISVICRA